VGSVIAAIAVNKASGSVIGVIAADGLNEGTGSLA